MSSVTSFLSSTAFVDLIILFLVLETAVVFALNTRAGSANRLLPIARNAAGICLLFALHFAMADASPIWILLSLSGAFVAHLIDLKTQLPRRLVSATPASKGAP